MARNRKLQTASVRFGPAVKLFLVCLFLGGVGLGYVSQKRQIDVLGEQMNAMERRREDLQHKRQDLLRRLAALKSSQELEAQVRRMNLGLVPTPPDQIVHLVEAATDAVFKHQDQLYADRRGRASALR